MKKAGWKTRCHGIRCPKQQRPGSRYCSPHCENRHLTRIEKTKQAVKITGRSRHKMHRLSQNLHPEIVGRETASCVKCGYQRSIGKACIRCGTVRAD